MRHLKWLSEEMDSCHLNSHSPDLWKLGHFNSVLNSVCSKIDYKN